LQPDAELILLSQLRHACIPMMNEWVDCNR
jgi:hypothetical protein